MTQAGITIELNSMNSYNTTTDSILYYLILSRQQTLMEQPPSTTSNCGGKQRSLSNRKVERWPTTTLDCTLLPILPEKLKLNGDYEV